MITRLKVSNFKSLRELEVEFGRLTVIVGANGCGKSSVLQAIALLRDLIVKDRGQQIGPDFPAGAISWAVASEAAVSAVKMSLEFEPPAQGRLDAELVPLADAPHVLDIGKSSLACSASELPKFVSTEWRPREVTRWVYERFSRVEFYQFDKLMMHGPAYSDEAHPVLGSRGENLAAVLEAIQSERREEFEAIESSLCGLINGLQRVRLRRVQMPIVRTVIDGNTFRRVEDVGIGHQVAFDFKYARGVVADQASEGTLILLGLLTAIGAGSGSPTTVMLDDLDRGLHPKAQKQLIQHLRKLLDDRPDLQIVATTHSPYLVEHLKYDEVLAMTLSPDDGRSLISPLAEHPKADRWREEMSAGEFWSSVGEEWVARGR